MRVEYGKLIVVTNAINRMMDEDRITVGSFFGSSKDPLVFGVEWGGCSRRKAEDAVRFAEKLQEAVKFAEMLNRFEIRYYYDDEEAARILESDFSEKVEKAIRKRSAAQLRELLEN